jgi:hypothetical protein
MTEKNSYKPVGGVLRAELYPTGMMSEVEQILAGEAVEVELKDYASHYDEIFSVESAGVGVEQTLTLVASAERAEAWMEAEWQRRAAAEGVVARLSLATGEELIVGWEKRLQSEAALRLHTLHYTTGTSPREMPEITLTLVGHTTTSARKNPLSTTLPTQM